MLPWKQLLVKGRDQSGSHTRRPSCQGLVSHGLCRCPGKMKEKSISSAYFTSVYLGTEKKLS